MSEKVFQAMLDGVIASDTTDQVLTACVAKEELAQPSRPGPHRRDRSVIAAKMHSLYTRRADSDIDELSILATTVETWWPAVLAFIDTGVTNARTEGLNRLVKQSKRSACGHRNPANGHRRIRLICTRTHRAATATSRTLPA